MSIENRENQICIVDGLFTWPSDSPRLIGSRCKSCGEYFFPRVNSCRNPDCNKKEVEDVLLSRRGKLWSYTIQDYRPPPPYRGPTPIIIGFVELPKENLKVMAQLTGCKKEDIKIGMDIELVIENLFKNEDGIEVLTWKFKPILK